MEQRQASAGKLPREALNSFKHKFVFETFHSACRFSLGATALAPTPIIHLFEDLHGVGGYQETNKRTYTLPTMLLLLWCPSFTDSVVSFASMYA